MTGPTQKRDDAAIWEDFGHDADELVKELQSALLLARKIKRDLWDNTNIDTPLFRDAERRVYAVYRLVGQMSELLDEIEDDQ